MMCEECYDNYERPAIITDATIHAASTIKAVYEISPSGGNLHIVIDDWNLEDSSLEFCAGEVAKGYDRDNDYFRSLSAAERQCYEALKPLNEGERASALALHDGYLTAPQPLR